MRALPVAGLPFVLLFVTALAAGCAKKENTTTSGFTAVMNVAEDEVRLP